MTNDHTYARCSGSIKIGPASGSHEEACEKMRATSKNEKTARAIINVLAENGHTVAEASSILHYVNQTILDFATIQKTDKELFHGLDS